MLPQRTTISTLYECFALVFSVASTYNNVSAYDNCRSSDNFRSISASVRAISHLSGHRDRVIFSAIACVARTGRHVRTYVYIHIGQEVLYRVNRSRKSAGATSVRTYVRIYVPLLYANAHTR